MTPTEYIDKDCKKKLQKENTIYNARSNQKVLNLAQLHFLNNPVSLNKANVYFKNFMRIQPLLFYLIIKKRGGIALRSSNIMARIFVIKYKNKKK